MMLLFKITTQDVILVSIVVVSLSVAFVGAYTTIYMIHTFKKFGKRYIYRTWTFKNTRVLKEIIELMDEIEKLEALKIYKLRKILNYISVVLLISIPVIPILIAFFIVAKEAFRF